MSTVVDAIDSIRASLPQGVGLVAVSKFHPAEAITEAYGAGQRAFGESRVQELLAKAAVLPGDIQWHFIGHLQTNKVRRLIEARLNLLIESVDSLRLLDAIDAAAAQAGVVARVLVEAHVAQEETKSGFEPAELLDYFARGGYRSLRATHLCGLMGMASNTDDEARISADFAALAALKRSIEASAPDLVGFDHLSMGMSDDYPLAIAAGATLVRIGTAIFGPREY
ncbi:MAG: YggS family pyridoxal phosphate-dependent enzyme [Muribaculaceae bacterium]|nr:YggS family pyridoxal phosphate-dependent enzyme [Muribaculaceae bacterium]